MEDMITASEKCSYNYYASHENEGIQAYFAVQSPDIKKIKQQLFM